MLTQSVVGTLYVLDGNLAKMEKQYKYIDILSLNSKMQ